MSARTFLVHGLLAGLFAGFAAFLVAHAIGEPPVDAAIALEQAHDQGHHQDEVVSRENQSTWGLATGTLAVGAALGGLVALVSAIAVGRLGRMRPTQSTALVALLGFVAVALVPFLKYPATPPAAGNPETIGHRTGLYFSFLGLSLLTAIVAAVVANRLLPRLGGYRTLLIAAGGYLVVMVLAGELMPAVKELGDFPAQTLWEFRRASITTLATLWGVLGITLVGLVGRTGEKVAIENARRELAASL
jgi:hypothetical protein